MVVAIFPTARYKGGRGHDESLSRRRTETGPMDLNAPLGTTPTPRRKRRAGSRLALGLGAAAVATGGIAYGLLTANPRGGEPTAVATIVRPQPKPVAAPDPMPTGSVAPHPPERPAFVGPEAGSDTATVEGGVKVFRGARPDGAAPQRDAANGGPLVIDVSKALDGARKPTTTAARPTPARPRVAIFVGGMGLSAGATREAIDTMPAAVTLAFVATGEGSPAAVDAARTKGHEVLLQLPMESVAASAEARRSLGPHSLTATEPAAALNADLDWLLGRFKGYDGVTNLLGAPVTEAPAAMTGVLKSVAARGLFYVDDGTSRRSLATALAPGIGVPAARADIVLDATADPAVVQANLDALVALARRKGAAIGMASGLPDHLAAIARYAGGLGQQGVELVPVGAIARGTSDVTAAR